ncbi:GGDEF/EAL domain-containing response regulator [Bowmanella dokdonensis]|uniref:EAL domain-containing protein n=1 Tax=Bowmanella dokdonensis TaxID=751969 RepID=A0A939DRS4_9ALTE|nr:EAL domain-containing protein [Bowmanella dokdonensis]MBN7827600.1 EAL domain-containing protein [Bowmanella dokdonensis]
MSDELFTFAEVGNDHAKVHPAWRILSVEDDEEYQASLILALKHCTVLGAPLEILTTNTATEAAPVIAANPDISVILLDVVMEDDDAGLRLVRSIRDMIGNAAVRIVLLTGQPGMAPCKDIMLSHDVDEYWCKSDLDNDQLIGVITSNIRTWNYITRLTHARQGLQMVVDASRSLSDKRDLQSFTHTVLEELGKIVEIQQKAVICVECLPGINVREAQVIAASKNFSSKAGGNLKDLVDEEKLRAFDRAMTEGGHIFEANFSVLFFDRSEVNDSVYLTLVETDRPLTDEHIYLLRVFSENISTGFINMFLYNRLTELSYRDPLLGINNRNWLKLEIDSMPVAERKALSLLMVEIDDYSHMGITFGEDFCDLLLTGLYRHLHGRFPAARAVCRFSTNTLALLLDETCNIESNIGMLSLQQLVIKEVEHTLSLTAAEFPLGDMLDWEAEMILRLAKCGLEQARREQLSYVKFDSSLSVQISERFALLDELRSALVNEQLYIVLQPKVRLEDRAVTGFEALVRWRTPEGREYSPATFIPLAETSGLIGQLDKLVLRLVCEAVKQLKEKQIQLPVAFNASPMELLMSDYFDELLAFIQKSGILPSQLELEITETQAMVDYKDIEPRLRDIMALGMKVSIDDFGTGYSSLSHIADLAASTLKIDRSFVSRLGDSKECGHVVDMILRLGDRFGYEVVAEGIETEEQRQYLLQKNCQFGQGYLFAKPMSLEVLLDWLPTQTILSSVSKP